MSSVFEKLKCEKYWNDFLTYKIEKNVISDKEKEYYKDYIENKKYRIIVDKITNSNYLFSYPTKMKISKMGKSKKRIVYCFNEDETMVLKMISFLLYDYDYFFNDNLYSFRKENGVKKAIYDITKDKKISNLYGYKIDIENYFNSVPVDILLPNLKRDLDDKDLYDLFSQLLLNNYVIYNNTVIEENKGIMAGVPISSFLANYYLREMDAYFFNNNIIYERYSDDIIIFAESKNLLYDYRNTLLGFLSKYKLTVNVDKEKFYEPQEKIEFLGFSYENGIIDLSDNTIKKIKGKIRRSARGIRRWKLKHDVEDKFALLAMTKKYNKKFFGRDDNNLSWKYWFFPTINTTKSLKEIDQYMQENLRYIVTGKHNKKNFSKVPYNLLKSCNYKTLVHEYYRNKTIS